MLKTKKKKRVYLNEFNVLMNKATYLPLVSGLLRANAERSEVVRDGIAFQPFLFHIDRPETILGAYEDPALAAFSMLMWNARLSHHVAREVKKRFPNCLIVVGGAHVPHHPEQFFSSHPYVDIAVRGEGEEPFREILERLATNDDFEDIPSVSWRRPDGTFHFCQREYGFERDLDVYPSPYLSGMYDSLMASHPEIKFQSIIETNRGCPFHCTFCYWGKGGLSRKYRYHSLERVQAEIEWIARHKIEYVFNADSNFGMHPRDMEIAEIIVKSKEKYGYPEKFRTCYGKNTNERIFAIGKLFHSRLIEKGITISFQSMSKDVQKNIKRDNINSKIAHDLQRQFNANKVPVYNEIILGLPGETVESWMDNIDLLLKFGMKDQLFIYICQVYPNTDLYDSGYQFKYGIRTIDIILNEIHGSIRKDGLIDEYETIVIATLTMDTESWRRMLTLSWVTMLLHSLKLGFFVMAYLTNRLGVRYSDFLCYLSELRFPRDVAPVLAGEIERFMSKTLHILGGGGRGCVMPDHGAIYWDEEEASFLRLSEDFEGFYDQLHAVVSIYLREREGSHDERELEDVLAYQRLRIPLPSGGAVRRRSFTFNVHEYFEALLGPIPIPLAAAGETVQATQKDYAGDRECYAQEIILWGRKSGLMLTTAEAIRLA